jgi:hypothetical protein
MSGRTVRFPRAEHRGLLLGLTLVQLLLLAGALMLLAVAAFAGLGPVPGVSMALSGAGLLGGAFARAGGLPAYRWLFWRAVVEVRRARRQHRFRARPQRPQLAGTLGLPGTAASLRLVQVPAGFAAVHDPHTRTLTAILRVQAAAFALLDTAEQDRRVAGWGRVLAGLCHGCRIARVQVLERTVPDSGDALAAYADDHLVDADSWPGQVYRELVASAAPASERHQTFLAVSLDLARCARQVRQAGGGITGGAALLGQETTNLESSLHAAGLTPHGWLDAPHLAGVVRSAYDPAATVQPRGDQPRPDAVGPMGIDEHWDRVRSDTGVHAVYVVAQWPRVEVGADFLDPLVFTPGVRRAFSLIAQPVGVDRALKEIRRAKTQHVTDAAQRARIGQIEDETLTAEFRDVLARERELVAGHGELRFVGLLAVTAPTSAELDAACGQVETAATQAMVDLRRLVGQQGEAFAAAALPLARGLQ